MPRREEIDEIFKTAWNVTGTKFTPSQLEWWSWLGQPMTYDGGLCVNRSLEEHLASNQRRGSLMV
jgi:hypothetical protein